MPVRQETRRFDERMGETVLMRSKEELQDYRYFPEPDIPPVMISRAEVDAIRRELPKMPPGTGLGVYNPAWIDGGGRAADRTGSGVFRFL